MKMTVKSIAGLFRKTVLAAAILLAGCRGITFTGNSLSVGLDDNAKGSYSPLTAITINGGECCIVANNSLFHSAMQELIRIEGTQQGCVIENNPGTVQKH